MSEFAQIKEDILIRAAIEGPEILEKLDLPSRIIRRWMQIFTLSKPLDLTPRYINRFQLGADPEFGLQRDGRVQKLDNFNLNTACAFGGDLNGRIGELRCASNRSTFEVVASTLGTLRWLQTYLNSCIDNCIILAKPFFGHDGLGGHVHFGRKRKILRDLEVTALDRLAQIFQEDAPIFNVEQLQLRKLETNYGKYARDHKDVIRLQAHGYEYRTLPTWLGSPWHMMLVLTLSKLFVARPRIIAYLPQKLKTTQILFRLLQVFEARDLDCQIARIVFERLGWPTVVENTTLQWNLSKELKIENFGRFYIPAVIKASVEDREDLYGYFLNGKELPARLGTCTWAPKNTPTHVYLLNNLQFTMTQLQMGEILQGLCTKKSAAIKVIPGHQTKWAISLPIKYKRQQQKLRKFLRNLHPYTFTTGKDIVVGMTVRKNGKFVMDIRKLLTCGVFPIRHIQDAEELKNIIKVPTRPKSEIIFTFGGLI